MTPSNCPGNNVNVQRMIHWIQTPKAVRPTLASELLGITFELPD